MEAIVSFDPPTPLVLPTVPPDPCWVESLARGRIRHHPHFRGHEADVRVQLHAGRLVLSGKLPSFYLKQVLQSIVRGLPGVQRVDNQVDVVRWNGLGSEPRVPATSSND